MKQLKPILHGRDHAPGGPDPIPGLVFAPDATGVNDGDIHVTWDYLGGIFGLTTIELYTFSEGTTPGFWNASPTGTGMVCRGAGNWTLHITGTITHTGTTAPVVVNLVHNGSTVLETIFNVSMADGGSQPLDFTGTYPLAVDDFVELHVGHSIGSGTPESTLTGTIVFSEPGSGGGIEWEDVGTAGPPAVEPWARYALIAGYSIDASRRVLWASAVPGTGKIAGYDPNGEVVQINSSAPYQLLTLSAGLFQVEVTFRLKATAEQDVALFVEDNTNVSGTGWNLGGVAVNSPDEDAAIGNVVTWVRRQAAGLTGTYVGVTLGAYTSTFSPACVICVTKLSPYP